MQTGLSTQLIRKWEERYEAVTPERMPNGYRGYTKLDLDTLGWLKKRVDAGVPIGMAVLEWKNEIYGTTESKVLELDQGPRQDKAETHTDDWKQPIHQLLHYFKQLDLDSAQRYYEQLISIHHLDYLLTHILEPALVELGDRWERGEISEYQEHFGSHFIRDKMLSIRNLYRPAPGSPLLVTACGPGERHELGILFFGFYAQQEGLRVVYLGTSPSEKGIMDCLTDLKPAAFTFSFSISERLEASIPFLQELDKRILDSGQSTLVFLGGRAITEEGLLPGTERVHLIYGDGKSAVGQIKSRLAEQAARDKKN